MFSEKVSGAKTDRQQLAKALAALGPGDTLVVCKLDRLARSTRDLLNTLAAVGEASATFKSLGDGWADTTTPHGRLMLTVLGGLAEFERHLILARTSEGHQYDLACVLSLLANPVDVVGPLLQCSAHLAKVFSAIINSAYTSSVSAVVV